MRIGWSRTAAWERFPKRSRQQQRSRNSICSAIRADYTTQGSRILLETAIENASERQLCPEIPPKASKQFESKRVATDQFPSRDGFASGERCAGGGAVASAHGRGVAADCAGRVRDWGGADNAARKHGADSSWRRDEHRSELYRLQRDARGR